MCLSQLEEPRARPQPRNKARWGSGYMPLIPRSKKLLESTAAYLLAGEGQYSAVVLVSSKEAVVTKGTKAPSLQPADMHFKYRCVG